MIVLHQRLSTSTTEFAGPRMLKADTLQQEASRNLSRIPLQDDLRHLTKLSHLLSFGVRCLACLARDELLESRF